MKKLIFFLILFLFSLNCFAEVLITKTAIATYGEPLYKNFSHFPYVNPKAKKEGKIVLGSYGTFDNLNPYILKGQNPDGLSYTTNSLMIGSADELMSAYPLIANSVRFPNDKSFAIFNINKNARYDDDVPITSEDFKYAFDMIQKYGAPFLKSLFEDVISAEAISKYQIKYNFKTKNSMKPIMIVASSSPLPRHFWEKKDFSKITLDIPPSSGPYKIKSIDAGKNIVYERVKNYWAKDLNVNVGQYNFDEIKYEFYQDEEIMFEAFKAGKIDFRIENKASRWMSGYNIPAVESKNIIKSEISQNQPMGLQGIFFNTRKNKLSDIRVRKALSKLFNFEYIQTNLLNGMYTRSKNYFNNSDWGYQYKGNEDFIPTKNSKDGLLRENKKEAFKLFEEAGYILKNYKLINKETGKPFSLEFLIIAASMERVLMPYVMDLRKLGIDTNIRKVDTSQYINRMNNFDFDAFVINFSFIIPPGVELLSYYGSEAADIKGSANYTGIKNKKIDKIINEILEEQNLNKLKEKTRELDKELLQGYYGVPQWYNDKYLISYWNKFTIPKTLPKYGIGFPDTWEIKNNIENISNIETNKLKDKDNTKFKIIGVLFLIGLYIILKRDLKKHKN